MDEFIWIVIISLWNYYVKYWIFIFSWFFKYICSFYHFFSWYWWVLAYHFSVNKMKPLLKSIHICDEWCNLECCKVFFSILNFYRFTISQFTRSRCECSRITYMLDVYLAWHCLEHTFVYRSYLKLALFIDLPYHLQAVWY